MPDISDKRLQQMLLGRRAITTMPFPGADEVEIGIRILTDDETDGARMAASQRVIDAAKKRGLDPTQLLLIEPELLDREMQRQVIWRSTVNVETKDADKPAPFFPDPDDIRGLDTIMVETLFQAYVDHQQYISPLKSLDEKETEELVNALGKGPIGEVILSQYDAPTLRKLVRSLASLLVSAQPSKSSIGGSVAAN